MAKMEESIYWEVKDGDRRVAYGPESTKPTSGERAMFLAAGYRVYIKGKLVGK